MKVLFLDIDGVINSKRTSIAFNAYPTSEEVGITKFDNVALRLIQKVCKDTKTNIILSSSWRFDSNWKDLGKRLNLPIIDRTPLHVPSDVRRGYQVEAFLNAHPEIDKYAIVDDINEFLPNQLPYFVQTDEHNGLSYENYKRLLWLLISY